MATIFEKTGLPKSLAWGFLGVMLFMTGGGIEQTWLSRFLVENGMDSATIFSIYGLMIAITAWLSGVIAETVGIKKTMWAGLAIYVLGSAIMAGIGIPQMNYTTILLGYAIRGFGYPLFAYTFIVWITYRVEKKTLSSAQGWFWFVFSGGMNVLGTYFGIYAKEHFGASVSIWCSVFFGVLGAVLALIINKSAQTNIFDDSKNDGSNKIREFFKGLAILGREPKVTLGGIIRIINTTSQTAFVVFMPLYMAAFGVSDTEWATIWATIFVFNIIFNLIFGIVGDKIGWGKTVTWFGSIGCAVTVLLFYYAPVICNNFWFILLCGILWCITLAGYVPLSALVPSLVDKNKGAAVSVLNLGAGLAVFAGPALVGLLKPFCGEADFTPVIWALAGLYVVSAVLTKIISRD